MVASPSPSPFSSPASAGTSAAAPHACASGPDGRAPLAVVTGAGAGIGAALTASLLARGIEVVAIDRDTTSIDPRAERFALDVRDAAGMARLAERWRGRAASHVFANAGVGGLPGDVLDLADDAWQWTWDVNVLGALRTLRLWWPHLRQGGAGRAVATLSPAGLTSFPGAGPYRASKAALLAALEGLHYQARGSGVTVHAMCPGMVRTTILELDRYPEAAARPGTGAPPNPFAAHLAAAMAGAEPAATFAERVLAELDGGSAPFYWQTHAGTGAWIAGRHRAIEQRLAPFADFGAPQ